MAHPPKSPFVDSASATDALSLELAPSASPFHDNNAVFHAPGTPLAEMFPPEDEPTPMKRLRWGTTRNTTGRPNRERVNRLKTLKRIFKHQPQRKVLDALRKPLDALRKPLDALHPADLLSFVDDSLDIIEKYADAEPKPDSADKRTVARTVVFNRRLPPSMLDPETHLPTTDYPRNKIRTAKYTALTFFPKNIWGQFSRDIANVYFLFLIILGAFSIFGVPSPVLAAVPLIVIVCITAAKDSVEDSRRTASDMEINNQPTHLLSQVRDCDSGYVYDNLNVNDESVSLWRRFKKWNTRLLFAFLRKSKRNLTKSGRAAKAREAAQAARGDTLEPARKSFDSMIELNRMSMVSTARTRKSMQSRRSMGATERTLAFQRKTWKEVRVGDVIRIQNNEEVPADVMILSSSDEDNCCFVETKNLDGETNLKVKQALKFSTDPKKLKRADDFMDIDFEIESEGPHSNLYSYRGAVHYNMDGKPQKESASINNMILRGCSLRNTKWVIGIVVFTGSDTKIMLNAGITPSKKSRISRELNYYVYINFIILFIMCFVSGIVNGFYYREDNVSRTYFEFGTIAGSPAKNGLVGCFVAVILYQSLVPISLYITIEIIKSLQAFFIYSDIGLYYAKLDFPCNPRSWSISDDLGQVEYIFSDKTGTLTQNLMEFRKCTIAGISYGRAYTEALAGLRRRLGHNVEEESRIEKEAIAKDKVEMLSTLRTISQNIYDEDATLVSKELAADLTGVSGDAQQKANEEFMLALALCHSVLVEEDPKDTNKTVLKAQSPDEAALVGTARSMGFVFSDKTKRGYIVRVQGQKREYQVLNTLEFNSTRKRMSCIIKLPSENDKEEPKVVLYCKGADSIIYSRLSKTLNDQSMLDKTSTHLEEYATEGLRTLCIARRELSWSEYLEWSKRHLDASSALENREEKMEAVADCIERELVLLGGTAIEDRLQDGVPESIAILGDAGIKLWVLTGDKVETAINIGFSCNLLGNDMELLVLKTSLLEEERLKHGVIPGDDDQMVIEKLISSYLDTSFNMTGSVEELSEAQEDHSAPNEKFGVVIDGDALKLALSDPEIQRKFLLLCKQCKAVLCCRVSPAQKAAVVKMVKDTLDVMTLAIGDGSNDVAMIQAADVGVGIAGEEGRQAAMSSDYALGQFRFLTRLLLTHGRWSYRRFAEMIPSFFFKNINYTFALFWYSFFNNFDGSYFFEFTYLIFYNLAFTSTPVLFLAVFDQDVNAKVSMLVPQLYRSGIMRTEFREKFFWIYALDGIYQSVVSFFFPYLVFYNSFQTMNGLMVDHRFFIGVLVTFISCIAANLYVWMHQYRWDYLSFCSILFATLCLFGWTGIWTAGTWAEEFYMAANVLMKQAMFWACLFVGIVVCLLPRVIYDVLHKFYFPHDSDIIRECIRRGDYDMYPEDYDPTDPNRVAIGVEDDKSDETESEESTVAAGTQDKAFARKSVMDPIRRQNVRSSYYDDSTSFIDVYDVRHASTDALTKMGNHEDDSLKDGYGGETMEMRRILRVRTSLEMDEFTTARSLRKSMEQSRSEA